MQLPGYNHYPDCPCGWCVNRRGGVIPINIGVMDAIAFLKRGNARSLRQCYVNPNATCPVCGDGVYFYANQFGSRVYFDELGPPWPKHPCTDNPRVRSVFRAEAVTPPSRRVRGTAIELVEAANMSGMALGKTFGRRRPGEWSLAIVTSVDRQGDEHQVVAEHLDSMTFESFTFTYMAEEPLLQVGDMVSVRGAELSFLNPLTLQPVSIRSGGRISTASDTPLPPPKTVVLTVPVVRKSDHESKKKARVRPLRPTTLEPPRQPSGDLTEGEVAHFGADPTTLSKLLERYAPLIKRYAREGTRKPADVATRLRAEGYRTMAKGEWSTRLSFFLLKLLFDDPAPQQANIREPSTSRSTSTRPPMAPSNSEEDIATKLSRLGRVTRRDTPPN
jgi:hypothetical protein